jgi:hypothetical protein
MRPKQRRPLLARSIAMRLPALALLASLPLAAQAQQPAMFPTRDVTVTYRFGLGPSAGSVTMASTANGLIRIDMPGGAPGVGWWVLFDQRADNARMVSDEHHLTFTMHADLAGVLSYFRTSPRARFSQEGLWKGGIDRVAGIACSNWTIRDGPRRIACYTDDGVLLRVLRPGEVAPSLEATEIRYAAQDPARFTIPAGYQAMDVPGLQRQPR